MIRKLKIRFIAFTMLVITSMMLMGILLMYHITRINLENDSIKSMKAVAMTPAPFRFDFSKAGKPASEIEAEIESAEELDSFLDELKLSEEETLEEAAAEGAEQEMDALADGTEDKSFTRNNNPRLPIFTLRKNSDGEIVSEGGQDYDLTDQDFLSELYQRGMESRNQTGVLEEYGLRFLKASRAGISYLVFVDMSAETSMLKHLLKNLMIFALLAFAGFFMISVILAELAVKPVEASFRRQKQFVADVSHELKTPLSVILMDAELLAGGGYARQQDQLTGNILDMSRQMKGLIEEMLDLTRAENLSAEKREEIFDLSELAEEVIMNFEALLCESGHLLKSRIPEKLLMRGDREKVRRLLQILLDNAGKYADPGTDIDIHLQRDKGRELCLILKNQCQNFTEKDAERVFERFYRSDSARAMNGSYGLGLSIASAIVESQGGKILCRAENGMVSFIVRFKEIR